MMFRSHTGDCRPRRTRSGLSALEVLVVVLIIGILSAAAAPKFLHALAAHRSKQAARRIAADLELARREAIMASTARTVAFDVAAETYTLHDIRHPDHPDETYIVLLSDDPYQAEIAAADLGGDAILIFDGYGQADSGGKIVVRSGTLEAVILIDAATGRASVE
jgi:prepilin-type N-terminal cleavage/methylation domain-containing protein